jgi:hypothetical protein
MTTQTMLVLCSCGSPRSPTAVYPGHLGEDTQFTGEIKWERIVPR